MAVFLMISTETVKSKDIDFNFVLQGFFGGGAVCLSLCISIASIGPSVTLKWISG